MHRTSPSLALLVGATFAAACAPHEQPAKADEVAAPAPEEAPPVKRVAPVPAPLQLDRRAAPPASVTGTVRDHAGAALAGAHVCAWNIDPHAEDRAPRCAVTDEAGAYELAGLAPVRHEIHASARERQPGRHADPVPLQPGERRTGVDLQLATGGVLVSGVVRSTRGGPLAGAWVTSFDDQPDPTERAIHAAATIESDADGRFELWLSPGRQHLTAHAQGFARARVLEITAPGRYTLARTPEAAVIGQVVDLRGAPVPGARVSAQSTAQRRGGVAYTDADGRYRIAGLDAGPFKIAAELPGRRGEALSVVQLAPASTSAPQTITLRPAASVSGRIVIAGTHETCSGGQVTLHGMDDIRRVEHAGPAGEVFFASVPPGSYVVFPECPGAVAPPSFPGFEIQADSIRDIAWEFAIGRKIRGDVVDADGNPLAGVRARAYPAGSHCNGACADPRQPSRLLTGQGCRTDDQCAMEEICDNGNCVFAGINSHPTNMWTSPPSDAAGRYTLSGLPPGQYEVVSLAPLATEIIKPRAADLTTQDADGVQLRGAPATRLTGVVVDARGAPIAGADVAVLADRGTNLVPVATTRTDDDGRFTAYDLSPGDYRARVVPSVPRDDEDPSRPRTGDVRTRIRPNTAAELRLPLPGPRAEIRGQVLGSDGKPAPDLFIGIRRIHADDDPASVRGLLREHSAGPAIRTDADGLFTLAGLAPGAYSLLAHTGGGPEVLRVPVSGGDRVTLTIPPALTLAGVLTGDVIPETFQVRLQDHDHGVYRIETFQQSGGRWAFEGLMPGTYELHAEDPERRALLVVALTDQSRSNLELPLAKFGGVRGRLVDAELHTPLAGVQVTISAAGPPVRFPGWATETLSSDDGSFEFSGMPVGPVTLHFPAYEPGELAAAIVAGTTSEVAPQLRLAPTRPRQTTP